MAEYLAWFPFWHFAHLIKNKSKRKWRLRKNCNTKMKNCLAPYEIAFFLVLFLSVKNSILFMSDIIIRWLNERHQNGDIVKRTSNKKTTHKKMFLAFFKLKCGFRFYVVIFGLISIEMNKSSGTYYNANYFERNQFQAIFSETVYVMQILSLFFFNIKDFIDSMQFFSLQSHVVLDV